jgi:alkane 1-monooxygenase
MHAFHYLKYCLFHVIGLFAAASLLAGGGYTSAGLLTVLTLYILGDAVCGDDVTTPQLRQRGVLTVQLWLALPLLALIVLCAVWTVSRGDPLGLGAWLARVSGYDLIAARDATSLAQHVAGVLQTGLMIGMVGTIPGHELTHRTRDPVSLLVGRLLLAFSFDTVFSIEHVYGHHRNLGTPRDPATAPRGRSVYRHILLSTILGNLSAWRIETARLARQGQARLGWHNAFLRGHLMSVGLVAAAWAIGGWRGALFFTLSALWGKALLEIVNYMEHYGIVRDPAKPVQPRHSWNTNKRISSWSMFNLTRHSAHHARATVQYQDLQPNPEAPMMIGGYLSTIMIALLPPLWHRLMTPRVLAWDRDFASAEERALAAQANARSGRRAFQQAAIT